MASPSLADWASNPLAEFTAVQTDPAESERARFDGGAHGAGDDMGMSFTKDFEAFQKDLSDNLI